jgi:hypothetical protein
LYTAEFVLYADKLVLCTAEFILHTAELVLSAAELVLSITKFILNNTELVVCRVSCGAKAIAVLPQLCQLHPRKIELLVCLLPRYLGLLVLGL